jgi:hypothetical protein
MILIAHNPSWSKSVSRYYTRPDGKSRARLPPSRVRGKILEASVYDGVAGTRLGTTEREVSYMKGRKAVYTTRSKLSVDGNSLFSDLQGRGSFTEIGAPDRGGSVLVGQAILPAAAFPGG